MNANRQRIFERRDMPRNIGKLLQDAAQMLLEFNGYVKYIADSLLSLLGAFNQVDAAPALKFG